MNIIFFGAGPYVIPIIAWLNKTYDLKLMVTTEKLPNQPVIAYCLSNNIPYLSVTKLSDPSTKYQILNINSPVAVLAHFGLIVPQNVIDIFPEGIVNIHPSLLPKYRGTTPGQTAILNGDQTTGVSIMLLDKEVDHGPLIAQERYELSPDETAEHFYQQIFLQGTKLLEKVLPEYMSDKLKPIPQDHSKATFTQSLTKNSGFIDLTKLIDKQQLDRMIRAYYPWPGVWTIIRIKNKEVRIKFLPNNMVQPEGKKAMTIKDFLNGYPDIDRDFRRLITDSY